MAGARKWLFCRKFTGIVALTTFWEATIHVHFRQIAIFWPLPISLAPWPHLPTSVIFYFKGNVLRNFRCVFAFATQLERTFLLVVPGRVPTTFLSPIPHLPMLPCYYTEIFYSPKKGLKVPLFWQKDKDFVRRPHIACQIHLTGLYFFWQACGRLSKSLSKSLPPSDFFFRIFSHREKHCCSCCC